MKINRYGRLAMNGKPSLYREQKKIKPKAEDIINALLDGDKRIRTQDFVAYVRSLKMSPVWASANSWAVSYKGKRVCYIKVSSNGSSWCMRPAVGYDDSFHIFAFNENLVNIMIGNIHFCGSCGKCAPGKSAEFWGQRFENVCYSPIDFQFNNPGDAELECVKKLVIYRRNEIAGVVPL